MEAHGFTVYDMIVRGASVYGDALAVVAYPINGGTSEIMRDIIAKAVLP